MPEEPENDRVWVTERTEVEGQVTIDCAYCDTADDGGADSTWVVSPARARELAVELVAAADRLDPEGRQA